MNCVPLPRFPFRLFLLGLFSILALSACAPNFVRSNVLQERSTKAPPSDAPKARISLFQLNMGDLVLAKEERVLSLRQSFANALYNSGSFSEVVVGSDSGRIASRTQNFDIVLTPKFEQRFQPWFWYLGILTGLGPIWPAMPRRGVISLQMDVSIYEGSVKIQNLSMTEEEPFEYFWYGPYRYFELQEQTDHLYRKLLARLSVMLSKQPQTGDASGMVESSDVSGVVANTSPTAAPSRPLGKVISVAIMDPEGNGADSSLVHTLNSKLRSELFESGNFQIMERSRMQDILVEQGFQQSGSCDNSQCYVKVGQLVGVDAIMVFSYGKVGSLSLLTLRAISVETGNVLEEVSLEASGDDEQLLTSGIPSLVRKIRIEKLRL